MPPQDVYLNPPVYLLLQSTDVSIWHCLMLLSAVSFSLSVIRYTHLVPNLTLLLTQSNLVVSNRAIKSFPSKTKFDSPSICVGLMFQLKGSVGSALKTILQLTGFPDCWPPPIPLITFWDRESKWKRSKSITEISEPLSSSICTGYSTPSIVIDPGTLPL